MLAVILQNILTGIITAKSWTCGCGRFNNLDRTVCKRCHKNKPGGGSSDMSTTLHRTMVKRKEKKPKKEKKQIVGVVEKESSNTPEIEDENLCVVCMENKKNIVFTKCRHVVVCEKCSKKIETCPICREDCRKDDMLKIYL